MNKVITVNEAVNYINDHTVLMFGGFGGVGSPPSLINAIYDKGVKNLTLIGNDTGFPEIGIGKLVTNERAKKAIVTHIGSNPVAARLMNEKKLEVEFHPQGTLMEKIRSAGVGTGGFLSDIGLDSFITDNKQTIEMNGSIYTVESALPAEVSIVYAKRADKFGNLIYDKAARNTNPAVAMAGDITIAEVEEIVDIGELNPEEIVTPGAYIDYIVQTEGVDWTWPWE